MKLHVRTTLAGAAIAGLLVVNSVGVVGATSPAPTTTTAAATKGPCRTEAQAAPGSSSLDTWRALGDCEITRRFATLDQLSAKVNGSKVLTSSDKPALASEISGTTTGLTSLKATVDAETKLTALKGEIHQIATDYRVYLLVAPQVHLVTAADGVLAAQTRFGAVNTKLQARSDAAKAAGKDVTAAQASLDAMNAAVAQAVSLASPLPAQLLPLTPSAYNGGTAGPLLKSARTSLEKARDELVSARADARAVVDALK
jgi:hypothetical protein